MKKFKVFILFILFVGNSLKIFSQDTVLDTYNKWFVSIDIGVQMSGIKSEDFISSNYSPLVRVLGGKWFHPNIGVQVGYQGRYFNAIADNDKHFYDFYFIEGVINAKNILFPNKENKRFYELLFHAGVGFFQNHYYGNSSLHGVLGAANNFSLSKNIQLKLDVSAIVGWDIYQGNKDILPSLSLGIIYKFN